MTIIIAAAAGSDWQPAPSPLPLIQFSSLTKYYYWASGYLQSGSSGVPTATSRSHCVALWDIEQPKLCLLNWFVFVFDIWINMVSLSGHPPMTNRISIKWINKIGKSETGKAHYNSNPHSLSISIYTHTQQQQNNRTTKSTALFGWRANINEVTVFCG